MSTKSKITILLVLTSLLGAIVFGLLSYLDSRESLREAAFEELTAIRTARVQQVEEYFDSVFDEASVITENPTVARALVDFRDAFAELEASEVILDPAIQPSLERYYERNLVPKFSALLDRGEPDAASFVPRSDAGKYLQNRFLAENRAGYSKGADVVRSKGDTAYERIHPTYHEPLRFIRDEFGYYDIFLIDAQTGDIVYTVDKEADFATNIYDGPYRGSGLGDLVETIKNDPTRRAVHFTDMEFYLPSLGKTAMFVGSSIYEGDRVAGILAIQLTNDDLNAILTAEGNWENVGLKKSGETYMVGTDGLLRNESRFFIEDRENYFAALEGTTTSPDAVAKIKERDTSVLLQNVDTDATRAAFRGETNTKVVNDYRSVEVLSAYAPLDIDGKAYALLAEIDAEEAFAPVRDLSVRMLVTTAIVLPLSALIGIFFAGMLMRPTREMRDTAKAFIGGKEDVSFQDQGSDEWGQLGQTLNGVLDITRNRLADARAAQDETSDMIARLMPTAIGDRYAKGERNIVSSAPDASAACIMLVKDPKLIDLGNPVQARDLYEQLDDLLDELAAKEGVDVLNQAGMHYIAFSGLTSELTNHPERLFRFLRSLRDGLAEFNATHDTAMEARAGFATSSMFGALVGNYSAAYEIWGKAVSHATDLAHASSTGELMIAKDSAEAVGQPRLGKAKTVTSLSGDAVACVHVPKFFS